MTLFLVLVLQSANLPLPAQPDTTPQGQFPAAVTQSAICNLKSEKSLGDSLLRHGFNSEAGREFRRRLWTTDTNAATAGLTYLKLGLSLAAVGQQQLAAEELHEAGRLDPNIAEPAQTALAGFYSHAGRYDLAAFELSDLLVFTRDSARRSELNSELGWLRLQDGDLSSAANSYDLAGRPDVASRLRLDQGIRLRSPTWAAVMSSFIPGSGEAYAGRPAAGLLAFAVTAGSLAWTVVAAKSDDWVSASVIASTLFWRFYNGSRANAVAFAGEYNSAARHRRIADITSQVGEPDWFEGTDSLLGYKVRPDTDKGTR